MHMQHLWKRCPTRSLTPLLNLGILLTLSSRLSLPDSPDVLNQNGANRDNHGDIVTSAKLHDFAYIGFQTESARQP